MLKTFDRYFCLQHPSPRFHVCHRLRFSLQLRLRQHLHLFFLIYVLIVQINSIAKCHLCFYINGITHYYNTIEMEKFEVKITFSHIYHGLLFLLFLFFCIVWCCFCFVFPGAMVCCFAFCFFLFFLGGFFL